MLKWYARQVLRARIAIDRLLWRIFSRVFRHELQSVKSAQEQAEAKLRAIQGRLGNMECAVGQMKLGAKVSPKGGSWVVIAYTLGDKDYVNFYDFRDSNVGALRDFIEKFARAGMATRLASPFDRTKRPPSGGSK